MRSQPPDDMDPMTMECLEQLLLAQAQECFWQKAVKDGLKDLIIARLAAKVSDLYSAAADWGIKSETISSEWIHHMSTKHHHFAAAAQYRAACDCLEKRKYGEEIARLQDSLACANEGLKEVRYISKTVAGDLSGLKSKIQEDLKRAQKDNDMIYLIPVPPKAQLKPLDRASMVSAKITPGLGDPVSCLGDNGALGKPLFTRLVPYSVHVAASIYDNRKDQIINGVIEELESLNTRVHDLLRSLNLPGSLQAIEKPLGLPPGLVSHAEDIRQQNGTNRMKRTLEDIAKLKATDRDTFQEGVKLLQAEAADDDAAQRKYGTDRWVRTISTEAAATLYGSIQEMEGYFKSAQSSDETVRDKIGKNEKLIYLLNGTDQDLEDFIPSSRRVQLTPKVEREVSRVRDALNHVNRLEARRKRKIETLRMKGESDDVNPELIKEAHRLERDSPMTKLEAVQFEDFFDKRLERYKIDQDLPKVEQREQQQLLSSLAEANTSMATARKGDSSTSAREDALQRLENAYYAYKEIVQNLEVGRKFYNDLAPLVTKFLNDSRQFAYARRAEAMQMESDIINSLPMANLNVGSSQPAQNHSFPSSSQGAQAPRNWTQNQNHAYAERRPTSEAPLPAPQPMKPQAPPTAVMEPEPGSAGPAAKMWTPDMPIKFGGLPGGGQQQANGSRPRGWDASRGVNFG